jgi:DNA-binding response OmpR family regulator
MKPLAMIVEDDPQLNRIFTITLKEHFEIESFSAGDTALVRLANVVPALVILDLHLPGASGQETLAKIRADKRLSKTRVIITTADEQQAEVLSDEADVTLLKPVSSVQLRELALRLCGL